MPRFRARTRAKKGDELSHPLQGELAAYEKVGLFARAVTPRSAYRYRGVLLQYQKALGGDPPTLEASCRFLARLREDGFKPSTLRLYRAVLQGFHAWRGERLVFPVRVPRCLPPYHSAELVNRMLALAETKPRDHVILLLMSDAGLRRGEVISLPGCGMWISPARCSTCGAREAMIGWCLLPESYMHCWRVSAGGKLSMRALSG